MFTIEAMKTIKLYFFTLGVLLTFAGCGEKSAKELAFHRPEKASFNKLVNTKSTRHANLNKDKFLYTNPDYPIELALYDDGKFYYNLPQLGDGQGSWEYKDGVLSLVATRYYAILNRDVDMIYEIKSLDAEGTKFMVFFRDRTGLKSYKLHLKNDSI